MNITCLVFALVFLICSFIFFGDRGEMFIPNWNKLSEEEREEIPLHELSLNMGIVLSICAIILLASGLFENFREHYFAISMVLWLIGAGVDVYFIEKKNNKKKKELSKK